ncbi:hypothetical protein NQ317_001831 [Molorchus minor]|uniref:BLOC-1-related complex subunit 6 C-terminal helix domain-containing protein n=1 Tax=Molorchus minor TaxID=1323400 RepID=A0ABQ9JBV6_9CUCU|nr:hypothetical protein NQ317_001831 [Molorchus minor]
MGDLTSIISSRICVEYYILRQRGMFAKNAVTKMSDAMDLNIKSMYTMMAKAEEVTQSMKIVEGHAVRIKEIKRLVDLFEELYLNY